MTNDNTIFMVHNTGIFLFKPLLPFAQVAMSPKILLICIWNCIKNSFFCTIQFQIQIENDEKLEAYTKFVGMIEFKIDFKKNLTSYHIEFEIDLKKNLASLCQMKVLVM